MSYGSIRVCKFNETPHYGIFATYFSRTLIDHAKAVPGLRFQKSFGGKSNVWIGYSDAVSALVARLKFSGIRVDWDTDPPTAESWRGSRSPYMFATTGLREYQVEGVKFLLARAREGALLADAPRLGKSMQATTAARAFKEKTVVLCPPHIVGVWSRGTGDPNGAGEIAKWWPAASVHVMTGVKNLAPIPADANVIVGHYDILHAWVDPLLAWTGLEGFTLILDELHLIVGYQSRRSAAIKTLRDHATRTIGLSGTPLPNNVQRFHNALEILSPGRLGFFFVPPKPEEALRPSYAAVFCGSHQETVGQGEGQKTIWKHDGSTNLDTPDGKWALTQEETLAHRVSYMMLRRLKKDVDPQLPTKTRQIIDVQVGAKAMIGISYDHLKGDGAALRRCLDLAADAKLKYVVDLCVTDLLEGESVLCFCYRRAFAEKVLADVLRKAKSAVRDVRGEVVHGDVPPKKREERITALRNHIGPKILTCTIDTTSTGIDLSFCTLATFAELTWEPHELAQAEERPYKFGSSRNSVVRYVIARGTGDELILRAVVQKLDTFERVIGSTGDGMKGDLSKQKENSLRSLYQALDAMRAPVDKKKRR